MTIQDARFCFTVNDPTGQPLTSFKNPCDINSSKKNGLPNKALTINIKTHFSNYSPLLIIVKLSIKSLWECMRLFHLNRSMKVWVISSIFVLLVNLIVFIFQEYFDEIVVLLAVLLTPVAWIVLYFLSKLFFRRSFKSIN